MKTNIEMMNPYLSEEYLNDTLDIQNMLKELESELKARKAKIEAAMRMEDTKKVFAGNRRATLVEQKRDNIPAREMKEKYPLIFEDMNKPIEFTQIRVA